MKRLIHFFCCLFFGTIAMGFVAVLHLFLPFNVDAVAGAVFAFVATYTWFRVRPVIT